MIQPLNPHNFFDNLPPKVQQELNNISTFISAEKGEHILKSGAQPKVVYQLLSGQVKYFSSNAKGQGKVLIVMGKGDWIGLSELFTQLPIPRDVTAITPVRLRKISHKNFENLLDNYPIIMKQLLKIFSLRFSFFSLFDLDHSALSLKERVIKILYLLSTSFDNGDREAAHIVLNISQEELSMVVGASRQKVNSALQEVQQEGFLEIRYGAITLNDRTKLRAHYGHLFEGVPFL